MTPQPGPAVRRPLFEVSPLDPVILAGAAVALGALAVLAAFLAPRRATRVGSGVGLNVEA